MNGKTLNNRASICSWFDELTTNGLNQSFPNALAPSLIRTAWYQIKIGLTGEMKRLRISRYSSISIALLIAGSGILLVWEAKGALVIIGMWLALLAIILGLKYALPASFLSNYRALSETINVTALILSAIFFTMLVFEILLWGAEVLRSRDSEAPGKTLSAASLVLPEEWKEKPVIVTGAARANYWHGKLHVYNRDGFRYVGDYEMDAGARRIVVLGDSLTYGVGVAAEDAYPARLEGFLRSRYPGQKFVVYNLGIPGLQSEDMVRIAEKWLPRLRPELVIYGICQNDFLPSGVGQYDNNMRFKIPIPQFIKKPLETRTHSGRLLSELYNGYLMKLGLRNDFFADILKDFNNYQGRFARDLIQLNTLVRQQTGRPAVAMVLDQFPGDEQSRGRRITQIAEKLADESGMWVVPTDVYYRQYAGKGVQLHVSRWEGHPNELAHDIFSRMLADYLVQQRLIDKAAPAPSIGARN